MKGLVILKALWKYQYNTRKLAALTYENVTVVPNHDTEPTSTKRDYKTQIVVAKIDISILFAHNIWDFIWLLSLIFIAFKYQGLSSLDRYKSITKKSNHDFEEKYPYICMCTQISWPRTYVFCLDQIEIKFSFKEAIKGPL